MADIGTTDAAPTPRSAARQVLRAGASVMYVMMVGTAAAGAFSDPNGLNLQSSIPWGRVGVAAAALILIAAAGRYARTLPRRPGWAHPIALRAAVPAALLGIAAFSTWRYHVQILAAQQRYLAAYTRSHQQLQDGLQRVDEMLAPGKPGALTRYTDDPCQTTPALASIHCWVSPQPIDTLAADLTTNLTSGGVEHLTSHCGTSADSCPLHGKVAGMTVRVFLRRVTAPSCSCPAAAAKSATKTLVTVFVVPDYLNPAAPVAVPAAR